MNQFRNNNGTIGVWTGQAYQDLPTYNASDFEKSRVWNSGWNPEWGNQDENWNQRQQSGDYTWNGDQQGYWSENYGLTSDAMQRLGPLFSGGMSNNWSMGKMTDPSQGFSAILKSGDKVGTNVQYALNDQGQYVPKISGQQAWDTNDSKQNIALLKAAAMAATMGSMGPAMEGLGAAVQGGTLPTFSQIGSVTNLLNSATGGNIPGLKEISMLSSLGGNVSNLGDFATKGINSLGDLAKLGQTGYNVYSKGNQLMDMFSGPDEQYANPTYPRAQPQIGYTGTSGMSEKTGMPIDGSSGGFNLGDLGSLIFGGAGGGRTGAMDVYGAYRGSQEARDEAFRLQNLYNNALARREPTLQRLEASYTDPNSFYDSNQWKGLSSVYQNSIDRQAASKGRMANPTDREVLMNNYAMKELENYRGGLRGQLQALSPDNYINPYMRGSTREAGSSNPYFGLGGRGSVGAPGLGGAITDAYGTLSKLAQSFGGMQNVPSWLAKALGVGDSSNPNYGSPEGGFESNFPGADTGNMGWSNPDEWQTLPIEDTSWIDPGSFWGIE